MEDNMYLDPYEETGETDDGTVIEFWQKIRKWLVDPYTYGRLNPGETIVSFFSATEGAVFFDRGGFPFRVIAYAAIRADGGDKCRFRPVLSPIGVCMSPTLLNMDEMSLDEYCGMFRGYMTEEMLDTFYRIHLEDNGSIAIRRSLYRKLVTGCGIVIVAGDCEKRE